MENLFTVKIVGTWKYNDKIITRSQIEKELREAVKERFEFLADKVSVKRV